MEIRRMKFLHTLGFAVCAAVVGTSPGRAETVVTMGDLPAAVQKTAKQQSQGATLRGLSKEVEKGGTVYEVELQTNGHSRDVMIDASGAVVAIEEEVPLADVPAAAKSALERNAGRGTIQKVEAVTRGNAVVEYEASVHREGGKPFEVRVTPDGSRVPK